MEREIASATKPIRRYKGAYVRLNAELEPGVGYMPHFERLPSEIQRSLISHYERLAVNRTLGPRERSAAGKRAASLRERLVRANESLA